MKIQRAPGDGSSVRKEKSRVETYRSELGTSTLNNGYQYVIELNHVSLRKCKIAEFLIRCMSFMITRTSSIIEPDRGIVASRYVKSSQVSDYKLLVMWKLIG